MIHLVNILQKVRLQLTSKHVETQCWVAKTVWQRIPGRRAGNSKIPTTETVQTITRNDPLTGGPQMLTCNDGTAVSVQLFTRYSGAVP